MAIVLGATLSEELKGSFICYNCGERHARSQRMAALVLGPASATDSLELLQRVSIFNS